MGNGTYVSGRSINYLARNLRGQNEVALAVPSPCPQNSCQGPQAASGTSQRYAAGSGNRDLVALKELCNRFNRFERFGGFTMDRECFLSIPILIDAEAKCLEAKRLEAKRLEAKRLGPCALMP